MRALLLAILSVFSLSLALGAEPDGKLLLPDLSALTPQASDSVSITLDATLLSLAAQVEAQRHWAQQRPPEPS